jgi:ABC-type nitrate/sulfonate/bicarbonate transport system permease component
MTITFILGFAAGFATALIIGLYQLVQELLKERGEEDEAS